MAQKERERHMELYPGWSARDNYAFRKNRKTKKTKPSADLSIQGEEIVFVAGWFDSIVCKCSYSVVWLC